jgi:hypothetical protein
MTRQHLQTIEVRYEDAEGRHVDVHEAAEVWIGDSTVKVADGVCACCNASEKYVTYNTENVVKVEDTDSEHYRERPDGAARDIFYGYVLPFIVAMLLLGTLALMITTSGGTVSL